MQDHASDAESSVLSAFEPEVLVQQEEGSQEDLTSVNSRRSRRYSIKSNQSRNLLNKTQSLLEAVRDDNLITALEPQVPTNQESFIDFEANPCQSPSKTEEADGGACDDNDDDDNGEFHKDDQLDPPPDGGYGWVCAFCVCFGNACSWGSNGSFAVFLAYYLSHDYYAGGSDSLYALMGGLVLFFTLSLSPFALIITKRVGIKPAAFFGVLVMVSSSVFGSFSTTFAQYFITQSFLLGVGYCFFVAPLSIVIPTWFLHKRSLAQGIATSGAGVGGIMFSNSSNALIAQTGDPKWALRMIGLVSLVTCTIVIILIKPRRPIKISGSWKDDFAAIFKWKVWFSPSVIFISMWFFFYMFTYVIYLYSLSAYGTSIGLTAHQGSVVNTVLSVAQLAGRPLMGVVMDRFGRINLTIILTMLIVLFSLTFWVFVTTYAQLIALAFCSGLVLGFNWISYATFCADVAGQVDFAAALTVVSILGGSSASVSELIGLKLRDYTKEKPFLYCQVFAALCAFVSALFLLPLREEKIRKMMISRRHRTLTNDPNNESRLRRFDLLLKPGIGSYFLRMLYPIKA
ncbi:unnamed protein product [Kuraishia capsulata CBS 1993]|uniref:Major facilitator superfamily (MFS) profile domain-containing protein n=1 Tax=Kuraishia capsulata CBS 1993 TaxID=1382522 RepID=W6MRS2_9ASCO|nr:uncharacterized protein KUCA_T00005459001 [Kuraishia capsulata CBS 1993]CDK29471.1 unnamed protein product [Kuraishia capsulata CBS 1993]